MASLASSAVAIVSTWTSGGTASKRCRQGVFTITFTGQGDGTDKILATALGFQKIEQCGNLVLSDDSKVYPCAPSYDGSYIIVTAPTQATDANRADPATLTSVTGRIFISGQRSTT